MSDKKMNGLSPELQQQEIYFDEFVGKRIER
jgi:hypothetical protein